MSLPKEINYTEPLASLPANTQSKSIVINPANVTELSSAGGGTAQFNLGSQGFLVPSSMYLRGKVSVTGASGASLESFQRGIPAYSLWSKSAVVIGSQVVEQINGYGRLASALVDLKLNTGQKAGMSVGFGLTNTDDGQTLNTAMNGRISDDANGDAYSFACALPNILSLSDKLIPLSHMPSGCRIELTLDTIANMFTDNTSYDLPASFKVSNLELVYTQVDFGADFEPTLLALGDDNGDILIKSQSYQTATQTLQAIAGTQTLTFNQRLSSVKSVLAFFDGAHANTVHKNYDAVDVTKSAGQYQFQIGGVYYPQSPIDTERCRASAFAELSNAFSPAHDYGSGNMSISPVEFSYHDDGATSINQPAKFMVGVNTERLDTNSVMLSGVSTNLTPISLNVRCNSAPSQACLAHLVTLYDAIIQINLFAKTCSVKI